MAEAEAAAGDLRESLTRIGLQPSQQLALLPEDGAAAEAQLEQRRNGAGRPPGASNRATRALREYLLRNFTDPAVGLAVSGLRSTLPASIEAARFLASALGCKPLEALELMRKCSEAVMPYTHSKMPLAVDLRGRVAQLTIGLGAAAPGAERLGGDDVQAILAAFMAAGDDVPAEDLAELENAEEPST